MASGTAVVVGASIAGLAAARVLSDHYGSVIVVERDALPNTGASRRGVPQGVHAHVLAAAGLREFERLLPGFRADLVSAGGTVIDIGSELYASRYNRAWPPVPSEVEFVSLSRPMLELVLRERVAKLPPVVIREGVTVTALTGSPDAVTGALLASGEQIAAELVVDCTGRAGRSDRWMTDLGLPAPEQIDIRMGLGYATRLFRRGNDDLPGWKGIMVMPDPPRESRVGMALPIEDDRWLVGLVGWHIDDLPGDDVSFAAFARALPDPAIAKLLDRVQPVTDPVTARLRSNHRRLFERLDRVPAGYVALGDAICSFNPSYGHGMTCAVQEAVALGTALEQHGRASVEMVRDYYQAAAAVIATPWQLAVDGDFAYPQTAGPRPRGVGFRNWFATRVMLASQVVPDLKPTFFGVLQLVVPPDRLMRPRVVMQVLLHGRRPAGRNSPASLSPRTAATSGPFSPCLARAPVQYVERGADGDDVLGQRAGQQRVGVREAAQQGIAVNEEAHRRTGGVALSGDERAHRLRGLRSGGGQGAECATDELVRGFGVRGQQRDEVDFRVRGDLLRRGQAREHPLHGRRVKVAAPESVDAFADGSQCDAHGGPVRSALAYPRSVWATVHPDPAAGCAGQHGERPRFAGAGGDEFGAPVQGSEVASRLVVPDDRRCMRPGQVVPELLLGA